MSFPHYEMMGAILRASIAEQIRLLRESRKLTQAALAKKLGTHQPAIARLEDPRGEWPRVETLRSIANFFDCALVINFASYSEFVATYCQGPLPVPPGYSNEPVTG